MSAESEHFSVDVEGRDTGRAVVQLSGELDITARDEIRKVLDELVESDRADTITVDLRRVTFIDSEAIGAVVHGYSAAASAGKRLQLCHAYGMVPRVFEVLGLLMLFENEPATPGAEARGA